MRAPSRGRVRQQYVRQTKTFELERRIHEIEDMYMETRRRQDALFEIATEVQRGLRQLHAILRQLSADRADVRSAVTDTEPATEAAPADQ